MRDYEQLMKFIREQYPPGTRIQPTEMQDPYSPVQPGTEGTINYIDNIGQFHMKWDNGRSIALIPSVDKFSVAQQPLQTLKLYMPLTVTHYEHDDWGFSEQYPTELNQDTILSNYAHILLAVLKQRMPEEMERGLMTYYRDTDSVNEKVHSYFFTVERVEGRLMGVAECRIKGSLTDQELETLKEEITGQASDGFGESLDNMQSI